MNARTLRRLIALDAATLRRAVYQLTPKECRDLERVADELAHAATLSTSDPWAPLDNTPTRADNRPKE